MYYVIEEIDILLLLLFQWVKNFISMVPIAIFKQCIEYIYLYEQLYAILAVRHYVSYIYECMMSFEEIR